MVFETTMKSVESPDSIPSMADTSTGSSHNPTDYDFSPRQLFAKHERATSPYGYRNRSSSMTEDDDDDTDEANTEVEYGSEVSITSSETTAVAAWNRTHMATTTTTTNNNSNKESSMEDALDKETNQTSFQPRQSPEITVEDPLEESVSCHGPLTTRQLAELLGAFQSRAMGNPRSASPSTSTTAARDHPPTPPPVTPREELLLRERAALKKIIQDDSVKIINLRSAMEAQRGMNTVKDIEIEDKEFELQIALDRIDALKKEKEVLREREDALMQTIQILKTEVDKLSKLEVRNDDRTLGDGHGSNSPRIHHQQREQVEDLRDHEEDEYDVVSIVETASELHTNEQKDGQDMSSNVSPEPNIRSQAEGSLIQSSSANQMLALTTALEDIKKRLDAVEKRQQDTENTILQALAQKNNLDNRDISDAVAVERNGTPTKDLFKVSQNQEEVEVVLVHDTKKKAEKPQPSSPSRDSFCCWDTCSDALSAIF